MAVNIPNIGTNLDALMGGIKTGSGMFANLMHPILEREKQKQLENHFQEQLKLSKAAAARAAQAASDAHRKMDPMYEINQYKALENWIKGQQGGTQTGVQMPVNQEPAPTQEMGEGMGVFSPEGMQEAQQAPIPTKPSNTPTGGLDLELLKAHPMLRGFAKKHLGFDPLEETPDQKRMANLQSQINLENIKTDNKAKAIEQKELVAVKKDLPTLEKSLKGVNELMRIAKQNPDMFGHGFMPDRFAKTTKIKDFGKWQNLISDAIAGLEQKLSARGNVVALKLASQLKPSHAEQQNVAIGKLESMRQQLIDSINNSKTKLGQNLLNNESSSQYKDDDLVVVEGPNGNETMTYAQAKALGAQ